MKPTLFGARYSVYTRAVLLTLGAKGVDHDFRENDIFAEDGPPRGYSALHPFGRIPAFTHDGFALHETCAINRYIDEAFAGPPLQPEDAAGRARMTQIVSMTDAYGCRPLVWDIHVERIDTPREGKAPDEALIGSAKPKSRTQPGALSGIVAAGPYLLGTGVSLADHWRR